MLSQQQKNRHVPEEETPPPLDQKHTSAPTSSWRGWSPWLRILGVVVACGALFAFVFLHISDFYVYLLLWVLVGVVSAGLLRSRWSLLIVPVTFSLGFSLIISFLFGFTQFFSSLLSYFTLFNMVLVELGVLIGTPIGTFVEGDCETEQSLGNGCFNSSRLSV